MAMVGVNGNGSVLNDQVTRLVKGGFIDCVGCGGEFTIFVIKKIFFRKF